MLTCTANPINMSAIHSLRRTGTDSSGDFMRKAPHRVVMPQEPRGQSPYLMTMSTRQFQIIKGNWRS